MPASSQLSMDGASEQSYGYWLYYDLKRDPFLDIDESHLKGLSQWDHHFELLIHLIQYSNVLLAVTGQTENGKLTLVDQFSMKVSKLVETFVIQAKPNLDPIELLDLLCQHCGFEDIKSEDLELSEQYTLFIESLTRTKRKVVILFRDAQMLPEKTLERCFKLIRQQGEDHARLHLVLFGDALLTSLLQNIAHYRGDESLLHGVTLKPFTLEETEKYLRYCLRVAGLMTDFPFKTRDIKKIHRDSGGLLGPTNECARQWLMLHAHKQRKPLYRFWHMHYLQLASGGLVLLALLVYGMNRWQDDSTLGSDAELSTKIVHFQSEETSKPMLALPLVPMAIQPKPQTQLHMQMPTVARPMQPTAAVNQGKIIPQAAPTVAVRQIKVIPQAESSVAIKQIKSIPQAQPIPALKQIQVVPQIQQALVAEPQHTVQAEQPIVAQVKVATKHAKSTPVLLRKARSLKRRIMRVASSFASKFSPAKVKTAAHTTKPRLTAKNSIVSKHMIAKSSMNNMLVSEPIVSASKLSLSTMSVPMTPAQVVFVTNKRSLPVKAPRKELPHKTTVVLQKAHKPLREKKIGHASKLAAHQPHAYTAVALSLQERKRIAVSLHLANKTRHTQPNVLPAVAAPTLLALNALPAVTNNKSLTETIALPSAARPESTSTLKVMSNPAPVVAIENTQPNVVKLAEVKVSPKLAAVKPETVKAAAVKAAAVKAELVKSEIVKAEAIKAETAKVETVNTVAAEPVKSETIKTESVKVEAIKSVAVKTPDSKHITKPTTLVKNKSTTTAHLPIAGLGMMAAENNATLHDVISNPDQLDSYRSESSEPVVAAKPAVTEKPVLAEKPALAEKPKMAPTSNMAAKQEKPYSIQLITSNKLTTVLDVRNRHHLGKPTQLLETKRKGMAWYTLMYGQFQTRADAEIALHGLPKDLQALKPWPKRIG